MNDRFSKHNLCFFYSLSVPPITVHGRHNKKKKKKKKKKNSEEKNTQRRFFILQNCAIQNEHRFHWLYITHARNRFNLCIDAKNITDS